MSWNLFLGLVKEKYSAPKAAERASARKRKNIIVESFDTPSLEPKVSLMKLSKVGTGLGITLAINFLGQGGVDTGIWPDAEELLLPAAHKRLTALDDTQLSGQVAEYSLHV